MISLRGATWEHPNGAWTHGTGSLGHSFLCFSRLCRIRSRGSALPRAWHGSVRTYLTVGGHLIVPRGDFTWCVRTVDYPKFAVIFKMVDKVVTTQTNIARILFVSWSIVSFCFGLGVRTTLETNKLLVCGHLSSWNEFSTAALSRTLDGLVRTVGIEVTVQPTTSSYPLAFVVHAHNI